MANGIDYEGNPDEHIAIIGMTGRFPGAKNIDEFWQNLRDGVESITFFTADELANSDLDQTLLNNPRYVGADGVIDDMDMFDAEFFNIPPREAELMDPQHRLFLECAWELMEQAGYDSESYPGRVAVYGSANLSTYLIRNVLANPEIRETISSFQTMITNDKDFVATRVSYKMNLKGPSLSVATLCSSGAVAVHMGCQALLNYQSDIALAGAISLQVSRNEAFFYQEGGIGDPDGHCRAFDAKASGTVSGSGVALVALKRLPDALKDGDYIHAVLRATAINNDGAIKYSYTAPSVEGQAEVIAEAIALADIDPETITYVETHGTGTHLGDPIEVTALTQAFRGNGAESNQFCAIGSVKTNIGHLVNAGGVASLIKTVLAMQNHQLPASLNFDEPNPEIDFENSPFYVITKTSDWNPKGFPRRAGVSSFGIGGTNVHMIVEEAPATEASGKARAQQLLVLSAKTTTALEKQVQNLADYLKSNPGANLADVAFTLQVGRRAFAQRWLLTCSNVQEAIQAITDKDETRIQTCFQQSKNRPVAFLFPAMAEALVSRGQELYSNEPTFKEQIEACAKIAEPLLKLDLRDLLYPKSAETAKAEQALKEPAAARAALFAWEIAMARLWQEWGIEPQGMAGEGVGELAAACLAGTLSVETALALLSGVRPVEATDLSAPEIQWVSRTTQKWITEKEAMDPAYWNNLLARPGSISEQVKLLLKESEQVLLEVGPGQSLKTLLASHPAKAESQLVLSALEQSAEATLGQLWLAGVRIGWYGFHAHTRRCRLPLPTYPFERKRFWIEPADTAVSANPGKRPEQLLKIKKPDLADWFYIPSWKRSLLPRQSANQVPSPWLFFVDESGLGEMLAEQLEKAGQQALRVAAGAAYQRVAEHSYEINPAQAADYRALFADLNERGILPGHIVHLWSLSTDKSRAVAPQRGFSSLMQLAQNLGTQSSTAKTRLTVISNRLHDVASGEALDTDKAALLGALKVIPQENTTITCSNVDVLWPRSTKPERQKLAGQLFNELAAETPDAVVAYRGNHRWVQAYEPVKLASPDSARSPIRSDGTYLLVGELDGLGLVLAQQLASRANLACIREAGASTEAAKALGAKALIVDANLSDAKQVEAAISQAESRFGKLAGVIYIPKGFGQATFQPIADWGKNENEAGFQAIKAELQALADAIAEKPLDFCLVTSSLSAVLGGLGLASYSAIYSTIDAWVRQQQADSLMPWISVNWDSWKFADNPKSSFDQRLDSLSITPEEGFEAFERVLACGESAQIVVSTVDLPARLQQWLTHDEGAAESSTGQAISLHARPELNTPYVAPRNETEQKIAEIWQNLLGVETVGIHDNFFELGGHSLLAVQIISRMRGAFGIDLPLANLFEQPTVAFLAEYVATVRWALQDQSGVKQEEGRQEIEL